MLRPPPEFAETAWSLALKAAAQGEVPVGSVIFTCSSPDSPDESEKCVMIAANHNRILELRDPTAHSEMLVLRDAAKHFRSERIPDAYMITSLEPCLMCTGAIVLSRIKTVFYFVSEKKGMGMQKVISASERDPSMRLNHYPELIHLPEYEEKSAGLLRSFFRAKRS